MGGEASDEVLPVEVVAKDAATLDAACHDVVQDAEAVEPSGGSYVKKTKKDPGRKDSPNCFCVPSRTRRARLRCFDANGGALCGPVPMLMYCYLQGLV